MPKPPVSKTRRLNRGQAAGLVLGLVVILAALLVIGYRHRSTVTTTITPGSSIAPTVTSSPTHSNPVNDGGATASPVVYTPNPTASGSSLAVPTAQLFSTNAPLSLAKNITEESTCQTAINATCTLYFVSPANQSTTLLVPSVDSNGGHLVDWSVNKYAPTAGIWKIYVQASLNGQTSVSPTYSFEVTQ